MGVSPASKSPLLLASANTNPLIDAVLGRNRSSRGSTCNLAMIFEAREHLRLLTLRRRKNENMLMGLHSVVKSTGLITRVGFSSGQLHQSGRFRSALFPRPR